MKVFLLLFMSSVLRAQMGASLNISPISVYVNQQMGASLAVWNYNYDPGASVRILDIIPQAWVTVGGSSAVPVGWDKPALGPGQPTLLSPGASVIFRYSAVFFAPSISPAYGAYYAGGASYTAPGTQTFSVGATVRSNDTPVFYSNPKTVTVLPISLPTSQLGAGGN